MSTNLHTSNALVEEIFDEMLRTLAEYNEFDEHTLKELRRLVDREQLKHPRRVINAILPDDGGDNETSTA